MKFCNKYVRVLSCVLVAWCATSCRFSPGPDLAALEDRLRVIADEAKPRELAVEFGPLGGQERAAVNEDVVMHAASTMKLFVLLALLHADEAGTLSLDANLPVVNHFRSVLDGSEYALDPADDDEKDLYKHVGESMHIRELARRMITQSSNLATNILIERLTPARVQSAAKSVGAEHTRIVRGVQDLKAFDAGLVNVTTAHDLALVLEGLVYEVADGAETEIAWPMQLLRDQEAHDMIPAGLPPGTVVMHKTGEITGIHHDAAIVILPIKDWLIPKWAFVLVVMTRGFEDQAESAALGACVARTVYEFVIAD